MWPTRESVPEEVRAAARAAFAERASDVSVLELVYDSLLDGDSDVADTRRLTFSDGGDLDLLVTVADEGDGVRLHLHVTRGVGQLDDVRVGGVRQAVDAGSERASVAMVAHGLFSAGVTARGRGWRTSWVRV